jgi:hypothetical protein
MMNVLRHLSLPSRWLAALWLSCEIAGAFASAPAPPRILTTRTVGNNLLVTVNVPRGWHAVVLESRAATNAGAWVPRAVLRPGLTSGKLTFTVPALLKQQSLRVRGELQEPLPQSFYQGKHSFAARKSSSWRPDQGRGEVFTVSADGSLAANVTAPAAATTSRTIVESDIWQLSGDLLYYFNQLRGLQIIDLSNPDTPIVRGTLAMPAVGEQMYLLDPQHVVLLARNSCGDDWQSQVVLVDVSGSAPQTIAVLPVEGWLQEPTLTMASMEPLCRPSTFRTRRLQSHNRPCGIPATPVPFWPPTAGCSSPRSIMPPTRNRSSASLTSAPPTAPCGTSPASPPRAK